MKTEPYVFPGWEKKPKVDASEVRMLWHDNYWDGPLYGMCMFKDEKCLFWVVQENTEFWTGPSGKQTWFRRFVIVRLTAKQLAEEEKWHNLFREHVGTHCDYDEKGDNDLSGPLKPQEEWSKFYSAYEKRKPLDLRKNEVLAWVDDL